MCVLAYTGLLNLCNSVSNYLCSASFEEVVISKGRVVRVGIRNLF